MYTYLYRNSVQQCVTLHLELFVEGLYVLISEYVTTAAPVWQRHHVVLHIVMPVVLSVVLNLHEHLYLQIFSMCKFQSFFFSILHCPNIWLEYYI